MVPFLLLLSMAGLLILPGFGQLPTLNLDACSSSHLEVTGGYCPDSCIDQLSRGAVGEQPLTCCLSASMPLLWLGLGFGIRFKEKFSNLSKGSSAPGGSQITSVPMQGLTERPHSKQE